MKELHAELVTRAPTAEAFARMSRDWFADTLRELFPELDRGLAADPDLRGADINDPDAPVGPPGATWASFWVRPDPSPFGGRHTIYSVRAWRRLMDRLATRFPYHVDLGVTPLDDHGLLVEEYGEVLIAVHRVDEERPDLLRLEAKASDAIVPWPRSAEIQRTWTTFIKDQAARLDACYGHITDDAEILYGTALERALNHLPEETVPHCRELLRGYSWVTICAPELATRLGGAEHLRATGAFTEVTTLANEAVYLQTTPLLDDYTGDAVRRAHDALAPVLPPDPTDLTLVEGIGARLAVGGPANGTPRS